MVDPTRKRNDLTRPTHPKLEGREEIDPEKFKKVLKVDASTEADKRRKRRMKKGEEGEETFEQTSPLAPPSDPSAFAELMGDQNGKANLFDPQSSGIQKRTVSKRGAATPSSPPSASEKGPPEQHEPYPEENRDTFFSAQAEAGNDPDVFFSLSSNEGFANASNTPQPLNPNDPSSQKQSDSVQDTPSRLHTDSQQKREVTHAHKKQKKSPEKDTSLLASQPLRGALKSKKKKQAQSGPIIKTVRSDKHTALNKGKEDLREKGASDHVHASKAVPSINKETLPFAHRAQMLNAEKKNKGTQESHTHAPSKTKATSQIEKPTSKSKELHMSHLKGKPPSPEGKGSSLSHANLEEQEHLHTPKLKETQHKKSHLHGAHLPSALAHFDKQQEEKKEEREDVPFVNAEKLIAALPTPDLPLNPIACPSHVPAYTRLSSDVYALFEKMVGAIIIQDQSGITSTTITLNIPQSVFNKAQITFDRYQTAPNSYNLQLKGTPEAVALFTSNIDDLAAAFKQGQHAFEVNILRPTLIEKKPLIRRKGRSGQGGEKSKK